MKTATLISATVKYPVDRIRKTKYGDKIKLVASRDEGGEDIELWDRPETPIHYLTKGTPLQILWDGERYSLLAVPDKANGNTQEPAPTPSQPPALVQSPSADVAEWIAIFMELKARLPGAQEQTWRAAANTLFMERCKTCQDFSDEVF